MPDLMIVVEKKNKKNFDANRSSCFLSGIFTLKAFYAVDNSTHRLANFPNHPFIISYRPNTAIKSLSVSLITSPLSFTQGWFTTNKKTKLI